MNVPFVMNILTRHQVKWSLSTSLSKRSFFQSSTSPKYFLQSAQLLNHPTSALKFKLNFNPSHHLKAVYFGAHVQHKIVAFFATKSSPETVKPYSESVRKSVWKSSKRGDQDVGASTEESYREKLYQQISMDTDLSKVVKEEMLLYELKSTTSYKVIFLIAVAQFIFWAFCANILFAFYSGVDSEGNNLRDLYKDKKHEKGSNSSFIRTWLENITSTGFQTLVQGFFLTIGTIISVVVMYLLTRCVSSIKLLPGAKQVKIGHLSIFGGVNPKRYKLYNLSDLSSVEHRAQKVSYISLRVRDSTFSFLLDRVKGEFYNEPIYDQTIGVQRNLKLKN